MVITKENDEGIVNRWLILLACPKQSCFDEFYYLTLSSL